jgi:ATP-dependent Clp protease ATP-binding subunit ClpA
MARVIQEHIKRPLAEELLFGKLAGGGHVRVEVAPGGEGLVLTAEPEVRELPHLPDAKTGDDGSKPARRPSNGGELRRGVLDGELAEQDDEGSKS